MPGVDGLFTVNSQLCDFLFAAMLILRYRLIVFYTIIENFAVIKRKLIIT